MNDEQAELEFEDTLSTNANECPSQGIYRDVPFATYADWKAINSGVVKWGDRVSLKHMHAALNGLLPNEDTLSRKFGRAVHSRLLEPETFADRVLVSQPCCAILKSGDRKNLPCGKTASVLTVPSSFSGGPSWFCGTHKPDGAIAPDEFVTPAELERIEAMAAGLHNHPLMSLLRAKGWSETSVVFNWGELRCKGRLDRYSKDARFVVDIKKMRLGYGSMEECRKAIEKYQYLAQACIYWKAIEVLEGFRPRMIWLFIEEQFPFDIQFVEADEWELEHAWQRVAAVLAGYQKCVESGVFPGYVKVDENNQIISNHLGAFSPWMAQKIQRGEA